MDAAQRSTLIVGLELKTYEKVAKVLKKKGFFSEPATTGGEALESISFLPFDAIVAACPLPDMPVQQLVDAARRKDSPCRQSAVVLLATPGTLAEAEALVGRGVNRVLAVEDLDDEFAQDLLGLITVPKRFPVRALSRLKVQLSWGTSQTLCQTENVSAHGMLVKTDHPYPVGTQMAFELSIPGEAEPVRGFAVVVRQTQEKRERTSGVGVRFSSFEGGDKKRLEALLHALG
jgi:uncharacterized protein (TIGR02266 family)